MAAAPAKPIDSAWAAWRRSLLRTPYGALPVGPLLAKATHLARTLLDEATARGAAFSSGVLTCICVAGVLVGVQTYPQLEADAGLAALDFVILAVFAFEIGVKVAAEGTEPLRFLVGAEWKWNIFDLFVVVFCLPGLNTLFRARRAWPSWCRFP
jgi:hypothetical protein